MATILLSIKPEFVERIFDGVKKFEFRKSIANKNIDKIVIYSSAPVMQVVGEVQVCGVLNDAPEQLWQKTKNAAGITREFFDSYFARRRVAYAYILGDVVRYDVPKCLSDFGVRAAPQGFVYLD